MRRNIPLMSPGTLLNPFCSSNSSTNRLPSDSPTIYVLPVSPVSSPIPLKEYKLADSPAGFVATPNLTVKSSMPSATALFLIAVVLTRIL